MAMLVKVSVSFQELSRTYREAPVMYEYNTQLYPTVQGAFILVGSNTIGPELLVVLTIGVLVYAAWRFWEAAVGQGTDAAYGVYKNFFKFRSKPSTLDAQKWGCVCGGAC
jgi:hypothetical protein